MTITAESTAVTHTGAIARVAIPDMTPEQELAVLARSLYRAGYADPSVGHITYRQGDNFLTLPRELGWDEVRASDALLMDGEGEKLAGDPDLTVPAAIKLHVEVHRIRPGCMVTVHQHPKYATVYSTKGELPPAYDQRSTLADGEFVNYYDDYAAAVSDRQAAEEAARAIGDAQCTMLRNHGVFVVGDNILQAFTRAVSLEWRCRIAWMVDAIGGGQPMPPHGEAALLASFRARGGTSWSVWKWAVRREIRLDPDVLL